MGNATSVRTEKRGPGRPPGIHKWAGALRELKQDPGQWWPIAVYGPERRRSATVTAYHLRKGNTKRPEGYEFRSSNGTVWARYVGR